MAAKRKSRKINPVIFVFCEGETEQRYIDLLRTLFRVPIQIVTKVLRTNISQRVVDAHIKNSVRQEIDKVYLFYDGDRPDIVDKLYTIANVEIMLSCPCVELWFLLHFTEHTAHVSSDKVLKLLLKCHPDYKKGLLNDVLTETLSTLWATAATRAKRLVTKSNPSTTAYILPEYLQSMKES